MRVPASTRVADVDEFRPATDRGDTGLSDRDIYGGPVGEAVRWARDQGLQPFFEALQATVVSEAFTARGVIGH